MGVCKTPHMLNGSTGRGYDEVFAVKFSKHLQRDDGPRAVPA
jgi:hypothetical protein